MSMSADHVGTHGNFLKNAFEGIKRHPALTIAIVVVGAIVVYILVQRQNASSSTTTGTTDTTGSLATTTSPGGYYQYSPPEVTQPIYIMPPSVPANTASGVPTPTPISLPTPTPTPPAATIPSAPVITTPAGNATIPSTDPTHTNPIIPYGTFASHQFPTIPGNPKVNVPTYTYGGTTYKISPGGGGRIWGTSGSGQTQLLYGPASYYQ